MSYSEHVLGPEGEKARDVRDIVVDGLSRVLLLGSHAPSTRDKETKVCGWY